MAGQAVFCATLTVIMAFFHDAASAVFTYATFKLGAERLKTEDRRLKTEAWWRQDERSYR